MSALFEEKVWQPGKYTEKGIERLKELLARFFPRARARVGLGAGLSGFQLQVVGQEHATTTRQSTGQAGTDFRFYPVVRVTPDVNGDYTVDWMFANYFDGALTVNTTAITNTFPGLTGGQAVNLTLLDNRDPGSTGRDPERNGAIAIGDKDFAGLGKQDGQWHSFRSDVMLTVRSPSGASKPLTATLGPENFKSVGAFSASMQPFALNVIT